MNPPKMPPKSQHHLCYQQISEIESEFTLKWITGEEVMRHIQSRNGHDTTQSFVKIADPKLTQDTDKLTQKIPQAQPSQEKKWRNSMTRDEETEQLLLGPLQDDWIPEPSFTDSFSLFYTCEGAAVVHPPPIVGGPSYPLQRTLFRPSIHLSIHPSIHPFAVNHHSLLVIVSFSYSAGCWRRLIGHLVRGSPFAIYSILINFFFLLVIGFRVHLSPVNPHLANHFQFTQLDFCW